MQPNLKRHVNLVHFVLLSTGTGLLQCLAMAQEQPVPTLRYDASSGTVVLQGLAAEDWDRIQKTPPDTDFWRTVFPVFLGDQIPADPKTRPAMLGDYEPRNGSIFFKPRYPFLKGRTHWARFDMAGFHRMISGSSKTQDRAIQLSFKTPSAQTQPATFVTAVYPSSDHLPANLLKFYIHFSQPMSRGGNNRFVHLLDSRGDQIPNPFLDVPQELWDGSTQRYTLFFHPGRIKRGLALHESEGMALLPGETYTLVVTTDFKDHLGMPLTQTFRKTFTVMEADRRSPALKAWKLTKPKPGTREPLLLEVDEPLDHALFARLIGVQTQAGVPLAGRVQLSTKETLWEFEPRLPWERGAYRLQIGSELEDLAGNTPLRLFDATVGKKPEGENKSQLLRINFQLP